MTIIDIFSYVCLAINFAAMIYSLVRTVQIRRNAKFIDKQHKELVTLMDAAMARHKSPGIVIPFTSSKH